jgi:hypothetical protein
MLLARLMARHDFVIDVGRLLTAVAVFAGASLLAGTTLCTVSAARLERTAAETRAAQPAVVVAELFTSEGCSSCPPADDLLSDLVQRQPVPGVEILALSEHVDYWDQLGWPDPFSSTEFSARQADYDERVFRTNRIYTPQLVVDGQFEAVGSNAAAVRQAILRAARMPKAAVTLAAAAGPARDSARVDVRISVPATLALSRTDVLIALVEDELVTDVRRGENGGRTLRHTAVVRVIRAIGAVGPGDRTASASASVPFGAGWTFDHLRAIAFLQERDTRRVIGAASARIAVKPASADAFRAIEGQE